MCLFYACVVGVQGDRRRTDYFYGGVQNSAGKSFEKKRRQKQVYPACFEIMSGVWTARPIRNPDLELADSACKGGVPGKVLKSTGYTRFCRFSLDAFRHFFESRRIWMYPVIRTTVKSTVYISIHISITTGLHHSYIASADGWALLTWVTNLRTLSINKLNSTWSPRWFSW